MTKFKDVHLYLGAKMIDAEGNIYEILQVSKTEIVLHSSDGIGRISPDNTEFKLLLRPLSSMTEEDEIQICEIVGVFLGGYLIEALKNRTKYMVDIQCSFELTRYLLSKSFDLFGLIENSEAVDATKEGI